jgi:hypothetical protein
MSEKQEDNIVTDEEFNTFINALFGKYNGPSYLPE